MWNEERTELSSSEEEADDTVCIPRPKSHTPAESIEVATSKRMIRKRKAKSPTPLEDLSPNVFSETEYRQQVFASLRVYKYLSVRNRASGGHSPIYLNKNLLFMTECRRKNIKDFVLGQDEPPLAFVHKPRSSRCLNVSSKKARLEDIVSTLKELPETQLYIQEHFPDLDFGFGIATLALINILGPEAAANDRAYRKYLAIRNMPVPPRQPDYYLEMAENETRSRRESSLRSSSQDQESVHTHKVKEEVAVEAVLYWSIKLRNLSFQKKVKRVFATIEFYMAYLNSDGSHIIEMIPEARVSRIFPDPGDEVIDIPNPRNLPAGIAGASIVVKVLSTTLPEAEESPQKKPEEDVSAKQCFYGFRQIYFPERDTKQYYTGNFNMLLIEETELKFQMEETGFFENIEYKEKSSYRNPVILLMLSRNILTVDGLFSDMKISPMETCGAPNCSQNSGQPCTCGNRNEDIKYVADSGSISPVDEYSTASTSMLKSAESILKVDEPEDGAEPTLRRSRRRIIKASVIRETKSKSAKRLRTDNGPIRMNIDDYLGKYPNQRGKYVNARKILEDYYNRDALNRRDIRSILHRLFPIKFPNALYYRIIGLSAETTKKLTADQARSFKNPEKVSITELHKMEKPNWVTVVQTESPNCCIICKREYPTLFFLMLHYNLSYPRLSFTFGMPKELNSSEMETRIDVSLNPNFNEVMEVRSVSVGETATQPYPYFLVTPWHGRTLRKQMRMDLTIFTHSLKSTDMIFEQKSVYTRYIHPQTGLALRTYGKDDIHPNQTPQPAYEDTVRYINEQVLDFMDVDEQTKEYMSYWNQFILLLGRKIFIQLGYYMIHRIFIKKYGPRLVKRKLLDQYCSHLSSNVDKGIISGSLQYDLLARLKKKNYRAIEDSKSGITRRLMRFASRMHDRFLDSESGKRPATKLRLEFNPLYQNNPIEKNFEEKKKLFLFVLNETKVVKSRDAQRLFLTKEKKALASFPAETKVINKLTPINFTAIPDPDYDYA